MNFKKLNFTNYGKTMADFHIHINEKGNFFAQEPHYHDYFQIYYVIKGVITHHLLKYSTQLSYGDVFIIPPNCPHYISVNKKNTQFYSCSFTNEFAASILVSNSNAGKLLFEMLNKNKLDLLPKISIPIDDQLHMRHLLDLMCCEYDKRSGGYREILQSCISTVLSIIARNYVSGYEDDKRIKFENEKQAIIWCIDYLNSNFTKNVTSDQIIKLSRLQRSDFCKQFKKISGYSFHAMLNKLRINKAIELIGNSEATPNFSTIADVCGYTDFSTFYRNFVKQVGLSPTEYYHMNLTKSL